MCLQPRSASSRECSPARTKTAALLSLGVYMRNILHRAWAFVLSVPVLAFSVPALAQTAGAGTEPTMTASGLLTTSGADVTQMATAVGLVAAPILLTVVGMSVIMVLKKGFRSSRG